MADATRLLYLEPDDEITTVVRRLREADAERVVLVASGRSKPTTSAVALRLLAQVADEEGREVALVADAAARALAGEAGIPAYASVSEASAEGAIPLEPPPPRRAPIHVVRGEDQPLAVEPGVGTETHVIGRLDETQAVPVAAPPPAARPAPRSAPRALPSVLRPSATPLRLSRVAVGAVLTAFVAIGALLAAVIPSATIVIVPAVADIGPTTYQLQLAPSGTERDELHSTKSGTATGVFADPIAATGTATFLNYGYVTVEVPQGTAISAGGSVFFTTTERVVAPPGQLVGFGIRPGEVSVGVVASEPGPDGNVAAEAIDRVEDRTVDRYLRGFPNQSGRRVINREATAGGSENEQPEITQADVDAVVSAIREDLGQQLASALGDDAQRIHPPSDPEPVIDVPDGLVGTRGQESFELAGTLTYEVPYLLRADVEQAARERLLDDADVVPAGMEILPDTVDVVVGTAAASGDGLRIRVEASGRAAALIEPDAIRERVSGLAEADALAALAALGDVSIELWPGWVDRVPSLGWRVEVRVEAPQASVSPAASRSGGG